MKKNIFFLFIGLFLLASCQVREVTKTHGISYLEKREKLIFVNKSNKNDTIKIFGQPSTKGMTDDNLWIYIERTKTRGKLLQLGKNITYKNNILILEFDRYGVLKKKEIFDKNKMKKIKFDKDATEYEGRKTNFIYSFLSSVRQKMIRRKSGN